jgi:xylulokinase
MQSLLLGIDIGTSGCKACCVSESGKFVGTASCEYRPLSPRPGWFEQNPEDWFAAACACIGDLRRQQHLDPARVAGIGVTGQMKGITFMSSDGRSVRNSILWNDLRNVREVEELKADFGDLLDEISYNPFNNTATIAKALWLRRNEPDHWNETKKIIFPKDYVVYRLTGAMQTDVSEASAICLFNAQTQDWWPESISGKLSFDRSKLPDIVPSSQIVGNLSSRAAEETGLAQGIPVAAGGSDATIESLSIGLKSPDQCKIRLGTAGALVTVTTDLGMIEKGNYYVWSYLYPGQWMLDNNTRACAHSTSWFRDVFFSHEPDSQSAYRQIMKEAGAVEPGCEGLVFHPYLQGEDSPYWDPRLRASFFGLLASHGRGHFARAVYEGTAFALRDARTGFGRLTEMFKEYLFVGGGTKNALWLQIIADVLGIEAKVPVHSEASFGAAMIAGIGTGVFESVDDAVDRCVRFAETVCAEPERHKLYSELFHRYKAMKRIFDEVYELP